MSRRQGVHNTPASPPAPPSDILSMFAWTLPMRTSDGAAAPVVILGTALLSLTPWEHMTTERSSQLPGKGEGEGQWSGPGLGLGLGLGLGFGLRQG